MKPTRQKKASDRNETLRTAIERAEEIILDASDGSDECANTLTIDLALALTAKAAAGIERESIIIPEGPVSEAVEAVLETIHNHPEESVVVKDDLLTRVAKYSFEKMANIRSNARDAEDREAELSDM